MPKAELDPLNLKAAQRRRDAEAEIGSMEDAPPPKKVSVLSGLAALMRKKQEGADAYRKAWDEDKDK